MLNFIKYEWLRRWKFFLAGILVFVAANVDLINQIMHKSNPTTLTAILIGVLFALYVALVFDHIGRLYRSLFTDEGFLELTLPLSGYQLLGAKLLAVVLESIAVMVLIGVVGYVDLLYLVKLVPNAQLPPLTGEIFMKILQVLGLILGGYILLLLTIYLSLALAKSIFASFKHGKLIAFGCFLVITKGIEFLGDLLNVNTGYSTHEPAVIMATTDWLIVIVLIGALFTGAAYLLDRKINL